VRVLCGKEKKNLALLTYNGVLASWTGNVLNAASIVVADRVCPVITSVKGAGGTPFVYVYFSEPVNSGVTSAMFVGAYSTTFTAPIFQNVSFSLSLPLFLYLYVYISLSSPLLSSPPFFSSFFKCPLLGDSQRNQVALCTYRYLFPDNFIVNFMFKITSGFLVFLLETLEPNWTPGTFPAFQ